MIRDYLEDKPLIDESVFVAKSADVIGNVKIGKDSSIWYNAVVRGDEGPITIGENTNIQDCSIVHGDTETIIGNNVTVGHRSIVHGCK
ncbi:gamma carbonic anhydrase family protein, partial [Clostridioides difficile]